jgi:DNA-binding transcriptional MerR regulator
VREGEHRSIGEVLNLLQPEFDDITISKIRFLESQGLVEPVRTPSGYRMFCENDIERLRWILRSQREQFLPLKVIKQRLEDGGVEHLVADPDEAEDASDAPVFAMEPSSESMSFDEVARASGISKKVLTELEDAGVVSGTRTRSGMVYDDDALLVAKAAAHLLASGLEVRHLRAYKVAAEREAGILEQLLAPMAHARNGTGREATLRSLGSLVADGEELRRALLRRSLRGSLVT